MAGLKVEGSVIINIVGNIRTHQPHDTFISRAEKSADLERDVVQTQDGFRPFRIFDEKKRN
jgi:hypothetical protein